MAAAALALAVAASACVCSHAALAGVRHKLWVENAHARIAGRNAFLEAALPHERSAFRAATLHSPAAVALLAPVTACPYTLERSNLVSAEYEGGKWVCGLADVAPDRACVVYSFGSCGNDLFERHVRQRAPHCEIHVFDPTSPPLTQYTYHSVGLCAEGTTFSADGATYPCASLSQTMQKLGHDHIDILKIDVEGAEWDVLTRTDWASLRVGQLLVELHDQAGQWPLERLVREVMTPLESAGLYQFSIEPVCGGCAGQFELGFVSDKWRPVSRNWTSALERLQHGSGSKPPGGGPGTRL